MKVKGSMPLKCISGPVPSKREQSPVPGLKTLVNAKIKVHGLIKDQRSFSKITAFSLPSNLALFRRIFLTLPSISRQENPGGTASQTTSRCILMLGVTIPLVIKKQLPSMLPKRLSNLSCNQEEFVKASSVYTEALRKSGYQDKILYQNHATHTRKKTRKRNIV